MDIAYIVPSESATLTSKGQVTIPVHVREALGIQQGDRLLFVADASGAYQIRALRSSHHELAGMLSDFATQAYSEEGFQDAMERRFRKKFTP